MHVFKLGLIMLPAKRLKRLIKTRWLLFLICVPVFAILALFTYGKKTPQSEIKVTVPRSPRVVVNFNSLDTVVTSVHEPISNTTLHTTTTMSREILIVTKSDHHVLTGSWKTDDYLEQLKNQSVEEQRTLIADEMKGYNFSTNSINTGRKRISNLTSLLMESGGQPVRNVIFATWRSGSTFVGDLLNSHPGTFYYYEPLLHMEAKQVRTDKEADAINLLNHLLSCNYTDIPEFTKWEKESQERKKYNTRMWRFCQRQQKICEDPEFISAMCKIFPILAAKTVRMRIHLAKLLLENEQFPDLRVLLLIRDPRGIMQSRQHQKWCFRDNDCIKPESLCKDMEEDLQHAKILRRQYPERFLTLRYEDISLHPFPAAKKIFSFFHLRFHHDVRYFLQTHTITNHGGVSSTYRDSSKAPLHWMWELYDGKNDSVLERIQESCSTVMQHWGYVSAWNTSELQKFNPLRKPPWPEMRI